MSGPHVPRRKPLTGAEWQNQAAAGRQVPRSDSITQPNMDAGYRPPGQIDGGQARRYPHDPHFDGRRPTPGYAGPVSSHMYGSPASQQVRRHAPSSSQSSSLREDSYSAPGPQADPPRIDTAPWSESRPQVLSQTPASYLPRQASLNPAMHPTGHPYQPSRRTFSNATASTASSGTGLPTSPMASLLALKRGGSTSSHSTTGSASSISYVSLMRKQKATVWCDRAQKVDPQLLAKQRAARDRVTREMVGPRFGSAGSGLSSSEQANQAGSTSKPPDTAGSTRTKTMTGPQPQMMADSNGLRASSSTMLRPLGSADGDHDQSGSSLGAGVRPAAMHSRSGSGRSNSSIGSAARSATGRSSFVSFRNFSSSLDEAPENQKSTAAEAEPGRDRPSGSAEPRGSTGKQVDRSSGQGRTSTWGNYLSPPASVRSSPVPPKKNRSMSAQSQPGLSTSQAGPSSQAQSHLQSQRAPPVPHLPTYYGYEGEEVEHHRSLTLHNPDVEPAEPAATLYPGPWLAPGDGTLDTGRYGSDELRRRGSVDDRSMTMSGSVRLYVANPDLSD